MSELYNKLLLITDKMMNDSFASDKDRVKFFLRELKKVDPLGQYQNYSQRHWHFDYVRYLLAIRKEIVEENYGELVLTLEGLIGEEGEYLLQKRFYANLIHILEKIE